jgi:NAD(P)H-flavin reductase
MFKPQQFIATLEDKQQLNAKFTWFKFELTDPHEMPFEAGQYVSILVSDKGERRSYSISSSPEIFHGFEILVDLAPMGIGSVYLDQLKFGDQIKILGPLGRFTVDETEPAFTFVATGSGLGPLHSMVLDLLQQKHVVKPMILYWGLRHAEDLVWVAEFQELAQAFPNFKFHPVLSQSPQEWPLCRGRVTDCLNIHDLLPDSGYYLCGSEQMVTAVSAQLLGTGIKPEKIHHEKFY